MNEANPTRPTEIELRHVPARFDAARDLRARVEKSLRTRSARSGTVSAKLEDTFKKTGTYVWKKMRRRPAAGVVAAGAMGMALASAVGVGELAIGFVAAYAAYEVLAEGIAPKEVARQAAGEFSKLAE